MERRASSSASQMPSEVAQTGLTPTPVSSSLPAEKSANENVRLVQQEHILGVLRKVGGNRRKAVEILGISERTLRYKLKLWRDSGVEIP
jgi:two-component system response regulator FlrC